MPDSEEETTKHSESGSLEPLKRFELDRLIRHGYAGFLLVGILLFVVPTNVAPVLAAGGSVVTPLVILAVGAVIYTLYRYVFNEMIFVRFVHQFHAHLDRNRKTPTNPANYLVKVYHVPEELGHDAYVALRRGFLTEAQRFSFDRNHTEATIVYLTFVECIISGGILLALRDNTIPNWKSWVLVAFGIVNFVAAVRFDIRLFREECRILAANARHLPKFLQSQGLIESDTAVAQAP
jgi:hypothetical protein